MVYAWLVPVFFLYSCVYHVGAESCFGYNFENDIDNVIEDQRGICVGMQAWSVGNYSDIELVSPNLKSETFIASGSTLSCSSTINFGMEPGGEVEVNAYITKSVNMNQLTVMAYMVVEGENDAVVGTISVMASAPDFVDGWQTLRFTLIGMGSFQGYLTFLGLSSEDSQVLIDSFKYTPPNADSCAIYEEECVAYNFERDFNIRFTTDNYLCEGFLSWHLDNYTSINIDSPNPRSTVFMAPNEVSSCITSFVFRMSPDGIVEANVYMEPVSALDHIIVLAHRVTDLEYDTVAGFKMYHPENQVFVSGWNVLKFSLLDLTSFEGYLIFIGSAEKGSTVLVDSVRYIPPYTIPEDDEACIIY